MAKKLLIKQTKQAFHIAKRQSWFQKAISLPSPIRYILGVVLVLFGVLGIFTPIPLGVVFFLIGIALFFGISKTRHLTFRLIYWLRLHIHYGKLYMWWKNRKLK